MYTLALEETVFLKKPYEIKFRCFTYGYRDVDDLRGKITDDYKISSNFLIL